MDFTKTRQKIFRFCSIQERCLFDVEQKLKQLKVSSSDIEKIIEELEEKDFLNETRFTEQFVRGKFKNKKWGRRKIEYELRCRKIKSGLISENLAKIDADEYRAVVEKLIHEKKKSVKADTEEQRKNKIYNYLLSKGFEPEVFGSLI
jgi:regulatory protein